jgi:peptide deformylase
MGHPFLLQVAQPVLQFATAELHSLLQDMFDTLEARNGAGLAAPQIGVGLRVVVFDVRNNPRYPNVTPVPRTVLINPVIEHLSEEREAAWEGCLSVPGMRGMVPRWKHIRYGGYDESGHPIDCVAEGFHARVVQHECDHLDGILYPRRIDDLAKFGFIEELFPDVQRIPED